MDRRIVRVLMEAPRLEFIGRFAAAEAEEYGLYAYAVEEVLVIFQIGEDDGEIHGRGFDDLDNLEEWVKEQFGGCFTYLDEDGQQDEDGEALGQMVDAIVDHFTGDIYS